MQPSREGCMLLKAIPPFSMIRSPAPSTALTAKAVLQQVQNTLDDPFARLLDPINRFAATIPPFSGNILEMHFDRPDAPIDFATRISRSFDQRMLTQLQRHHTQLTQLHRHPARSPILPASLFHPAVENCWIEYDAPFENAPALFFDIDRNGAFDPERAYTCFREIVTVYDIPENKDLLPFLQKVKGLGASVVYYGLMFSRPSRSIRLTINGIQPGNLAQALTGLGWKGNYDTLKKICRQYLHEGQKIVLAVDWENGLQNRIGIEIFDEDNNRLMEQFHAGNLISSRHVNWFKQWERVSDMPDDLSNTLSQQHGRPIKVLHTRINHFKFVISNSECVSLKGYLYYCF
jgi:hypothetical protein